MFKEFFLFEIKTRLQRPMIYVFVLINFLLIFAATAASDHVMIGSSNDAVFVNAPHVIMKTTLMMTLIGIFMTTAFMNTAILRDFDYKFDGILFSTPIQKMAYLSGRFFGAFLMALIPFLGVFAGIFFGAMSPWVAVTETAAFMPSVYFWTFFMGVIPNTLLISAIVFMLAALFRSSLFSFVGAVAILIGYLMMVNFSADLDYEYFSILSDPLAISSHEILTKYWTVEEKNTQCLAFSGPILWNRIIWVTISFCILAFTYFRFSFARKKSIFTKKKKVISELQKITAVPAKLSPLPVVQIMDDTKTSLKQFLYQSKMEFLGIVKSTPFIVLLVFGMINMVNAISISDESYGTGNHPVTYLIIDAIRNSFYLYIIAILMYYSGVVIWREREAKMNELFDCAPFPVWIPFVSKLLGLLGILVVIMLLAITSGVLFQAASGYTNFELSIYLQEFLVYDLMKFSFFLVLAMLVQVLVNNKYLGYFVFIILVILLNYAPVAAEIESHLVIFGSTPSYVYSDMNAWDAFEKGMTWFNTYWFFFAGLLGIVAILFWVRGLALSWKQRLQIARQRFNGKLILTTAVLGLLWLGTGSFLFYQTKVLNEISSEEAKDLERVDYEKKYKQYEHIAQPRITDIDFDISIYPEERNFIAKAKVQIKNKTKETIDELHFTLQDDLQIEIEIPGAKQVLDDKASAYQIHELTKSLQPGDSLSFLVRSSYFTKGIENEVSNTDIVSNGTFLSNYKIMPIIGYTESGELSDKKKRAKHNLAKKARKEKLHETCGHRCQNSYISSDADWVNVTSTISTSLDQTAIAPGSFIKEWEQENRRYFRYELKKPVLNFYSFISGKYEIERDIWTSPSGQKVDVEVYYHKGHEYNVDKMIKSLKNSLTYYSQHFTSYPHEQARIIEFPRYASFAQAFPGTMPYSESMGFIANLKEENAIDMVYYVVAHEMAHQWWAHQVIGADVQGATMLSETFSQYSALMVMQKEYGKDKMKQFLKYEMDRYLRSRGGETEKELPLIYNEDQGYIHYRKGSVVMYALQDYIGEDRLNLALKRFAEAVSYQEPPYTNTLEVMDYIEEVTPDSLKYLLDDMFRNIVLYSNSTEEATYRKLANGKYEVTVDVSVEKYSADSLGKETLIPHNDFIDIGIYSEEVAQGERYGKPILVERHRISEKRKQFTFVVNELPFKAGIDPNYLLIDRFPGDNLKKLSLKE